MHIIFLEIFKVWFRTLPHTFYDISIHWPFNLLLQIQGLTFWSCFPQKTVYCLNEARVKSYVALKLKKHLKLFSSFERVVWRIISVNKSMRLHPWPSNSIFFFLGLIHPGTNSFQHKVICILCWLAQLLRNFIFLV